MNKAPKQLIVLTSKYLNPIFPEVFIAAVCS